MHPVLSHRNYFTTRSDAADRNANHVPKKDGFVRRWSRSLYESWKRRRMIAALHAMDDRVLRDIGIYRNDIESVVDGLEERDRGMAPLASSTTARMQDHSGPRMAA